MLYSNVRGLVRAVHASEGVRRRSDATGDRRQVHRRVQTALSERRQLRRVQLDVRRSKQNTEVPYVQHGSRQRDDFQSL